MKNTIWSAIVAAIVSLLVISIYPAQKMLPGVMEQKESAYDRVMRTKTIRCEYATFAPSLVSDVNTKQISGYTVDLMNEIGRRLGLKVEWVEETTYGQMVEGLNSGRADVFCAATGLNVHRAKFTLATQPFFYAPIYLAVRPDDTRFAGNNPMRANGEDIKFLIVDGDIADTISRNNFPKAQRVSSPQLVDWPTMLQDVVAGKTDVVLAEPYTFREFDKNNPGKLKMLDQGRPASLLPVGFVVNKGEAQLKYMLDMALSEMTNEGYIHAVLSKYFDDPAKYVLEPSEPFRLETKK
ncbi:MAG: amino acid ABC transporter substrate-binding protein [Alphaproteobacteria bacterium]|nr:MAG: amino acid ABC transporter substrate-binding protein [Alphaproteobacteria bacterium]